MRILFLSTWFPYPPDNGSKLRAHYLIRSLAQTHEVTVIAFQPENALDKTLTRMRGPTDTPVWGVPEDPFRYVDLPQVVKYLSPIPLAAWPSAYMQRAVGSVGRSTHWDAVVAFETPVARYAFIPDSTARVFDIDNSLSFIGKERLSGQKGILARCRARISLYKALRYESRLARQFQACTVVSPLEAGWVRSMVRGTSCRVEVNSNGVDCTHNQPGVAQPQANALVYNGALTYSANYDAMRWFLAEIYPRIRAELPAVSLTITGSTHGVNLAGLALDGTVRLTGLVDDVRLPVAGAAVCIAPIRQGAGTRLKILEAMALGTPVVATSKGAEGLEATHGRDILIADEPADLANQVVHLLRDAAMRDYLSRNARSLVEERYDWQAIGQRFVDLVEAVTLERRSC